MNLALTPERLRTLTLTNCDAHDNLPPPNFRAGCPFRVRFR